MTENKVITDVILVVKGAGVHKIDETLHMFLKGFYPAVRKLENREFVKNVKMRLKRESQLFHKKDSEQKVAEITFEETQKCEIPEKERREHQKIDTEEGQEDEKITSHRIWIKEAYWEPHLNPPGALKALFGEWRLTSFSLRRLFEDFFFPWHDGGSYYEYEEGEEKKPRNKNKWKSSVLGYFLYYFLTYASVLVFIGLVGLWNNSLLYSIFSVQRKATINILFQPTLNTILFGLLGIAFTMALASAFRSWRVKSKPEGNTDRMPGLGSWLLWALVVLMIFQPINYFIFWLTYFFIVVMPVILARKIAWGKRSNWYTDTPVKYFINEKEKFLDYRFSRLEKSTQLIYRFFVVIGLPIAVAVLLVSKLFLILNLLGNDIGTKIDTAISTAVNLILGDVTAYALDPAQAASVQNVIEEEIKTFTDLCMNDNGINYIHVFAHSQGTPITYEVLYHLLDNNYCKKIRSYLTIGSILNLHNQTNEVLDTFNWNRFPPSREKFKKGKFTDDFKWFNFWNFTDPITQFTGLEAFRQPELLLYKNGKIRYYKNDNSPRLDFGDGSPFSIKTKDSFTKNHSEYWTNVDEIHYPFVKHIVKVKGRWLPDEWASEGDLREKIRDRKKFNFNLIDKQKYSRKLKSHRWLVFILWLFITTGLILAGFLIPTSFFEWVSAKIKPFTMNSGLSLSEPEGLWNTITGIYYDQRLVVIAVFILIIMAISEFVSLIIEEKDLELDDEG